MKWIYPLCLIILLSYVATLNGEKNRINENSMKKMKEHMAKIRNLIRNLNEEDTGSSDDSGPSDDSSGNDPNANTTDTTDPGLTALTTAEFAENRDAEVQLLGIYGFEEGPPITFFSFFLFIGRSIPNTIVFTLEILFDSRLRRLNKVEKVPATCKKADSSDNEGAIKYKCTADYDKSLGTPKQIVVDPDVKVDGKTYSATKGDINFSEQAQKNSLDLKEAPSTKIDKMYNLANGVKKENSNNFIISGDIDESNNIKVGDDFTLYVYDKDTKPQKEQKVSCKVQSVKDKHYEIKCTPSEEVKGVIQNSQMISPDGSTAINIRMKNSSDDKLDFTPGGAHTIKNNPIYRKSSSGLSGGAIAGIVIACAVVLIIASIIAMMMRKPAVPVNNASTVVGLRTVDNYTE